MAGDDDWRLMGQERYLFGKALRLARWTTHKPGWDHDHCEFCSAKIWDQPSEGDFDSGYVTVADRYHWVCPRCFEDFRLPFRVAQLRLGHLKTNAGLAVRL